MEDMLIPSTEEGWGTLKGKLVEWYENILLYLPNILLAILALVIFLFLGRLLSHLVRRIAKKLNLPYEFAGLLATLAYLIIGGVGLFAALGILNLNKTVTSLLAGAGIIGLVLSLAFQNVAINILSGAIISVRRPIAVGDVIESNGFFGTVEYINWRTTHLITFQGQYVHIPNKEMIEHPVSNYTKWGRRRVEVTMRIGLEADPEEVRRVAIAALEEVPERITAFPPEFFFEEFEADALQGKARFWIPYARDTINRSYKESVHQAIVRLRNNFYKAGIRLPYPQYRVNLEEHYKNESDAGSPSQASVAVRSSRDGQEDA